MERRNWYYEHSFTGMNTQAEAEAWIIDNQEHLAHYIDDRWQVTESIRQIPSLGNDVWQATVRARKNV